MIDNNETNRIATVHPSSLVQSIEKYLVTGSSKTMTRVLSASCLTVSDTGTVFPSLVRNRTTFPLRIRWCYQWSP